MYGVTMVNYPKKSSALEMSFYFESVLTSRRAKHKACT